MPDGSLSIRHNFTGESQFVIMRWYRSSAPLTELGREVYTAPHVEESFIIENLQPVWHLIEFWRSSDGIALDELLLTLAGNARSGAVYPVSRYEYIVDRGNSEAGVWADPVQNDTGLRDTRLLNMFYWVEERGTGSLLTTDIIDRSDDGGGFDFSSLDKVMNSEAVYIVTAIRRIDIIGDSGGSGIIDNSEDDIFILNVDQDYVHADMNNKTLISDFITTVGTLTMPNLALLPDARFEIQTHQGVQRNVVLQLDAGDTVWFRGAQVNKIVLGKGELMAFTIKNNVLYVRDTETNHFRLGQRIWADMILLNTMPCDGALLVLADYPRVEQLLDSLPVGAVVNSATWNASTVEADGQTSFPNKGRWMREGLNFRPPDMRNKSVRAINLTDGSVASGGYSHGLVGPHFHDAGTETTNVSKFRRSNLDHQRKNWNVGNTDNSDKSSTDINKLFASETYATENKVNSTLQFPLVCI